jgi:hypothetical protein
MLFFNNEFCSLPLGNLHREADFGRLWDGDLHRGRAGNQPQRARFGRLRFRRKRSCSLASHLPIQRNGQCAGRGQQKEHGGQPTAAPAGPGLLPTFIPTQCVQQVHARASFLRPKQATLEQATADHSMKMTKFCSMDVRFAGNRRPATEHHATCHRFSHFFRNILTEKCTSS